MNRKFIPGLVMLFSMFFSGSGNAANCVDIRVELLWSAFQCAGCHGADGRGRLPNGASLRGRVRASNYTVNTFILRVRNGFRRMQPRPEICDENLQQIYEFLGGNTVTAMAPPPASPPQMPPSPPARMTPPGSGNQGSRPQGRPGENTVSRGGRGLLPGQGAFAGRPSPRGTANSRQQVISRRAALCRNQPTLAMCRNMPRWSQDIIRNQRRGAYTRADAIARQRAEEQRRRRQEEQIRAQNADLYQLGMVLKQHAYYLALKYTRCKPSNQLRADRIQEHFATPIRKTCRMGHIRSNKVGRMTLDEFLRGRIPTDRNPSQGGGGFGSGSISEPGQISGFVNVPVGGEVCVVPERFNGQAIVRWTCGLFRDGIVTCPPRGNLVKITRTRTKVTFKCMHGNWAQFAQDLRRVYRNGALYDR